MVVLPTPLMVKVLELTVATLEFPLTKVQAPGEVDTGIVKVKGPVP